MNGETFAVLVGVLACAAAVAVGGAIAGRMPAVMLCVGAGLLALAALLWAAVRWSGGGRA
jgi:hypothetical protein